MKLIQMRVALLLFATFIFGIVLTNLNTVQTIRSKAALNSLTVSGLKAAFPSKRGDANYNQAYDINLDGVIADLDYIQLRTKIAAKRPQDAGMLNWIKRPFVGSASVFSTANGSNLQDVQDDILVTGVMMQISGISKGEVFDICPMNVTRSKPPLYDAGTGGFSEIFCYYVSRLHSAENIDVYIDLNDTPLFLSKGSTVLCSVTAYGVPAGKGSNLKKNCHLTYKKYYPGDKRYRSIRFPYYDQAVIPETNSIPPSYYVSQKNFPLKIRSLHWFTSFGGMEGNISAKVCMNHVKQGGAVVNSQCMTQLQEIGKNVTFQQPSSLSMDIPVGDLVGVTCMMGQKDTDCAAWAVIEIPDSIQAASPEISLFNFGWVAEHYLAQYCRQFSKYMHFPAHCPNNTCTAEAKINRCMQLFPPASCVSNGSCMKQ